MNRNFSILLVAQFLTAFADNAILFTAIAMILQSGSQDGWYVPALQGSFLVAFVLLAPWVGPFADMQPKAKVLSMANIIKAVGAVMMLSQIDPLVAYAVVGIGAAMYSPAKYGILPELVSHDQLVRVNGWIEGSTILAILAGSMVGSWIADDSIAAALWTVIVLYGVSSFATLFIEMIPPRIHERVAALPNFIHMTRRLLHTSRARFATLGVSLFWGAAVGLRVMLVAWAPAVLALTTTHAIAELTLYTAIGIAIGSLLVPRIIPLEHLRRARIASYAMGACIVLLAFVDTIWAARAVLLLAGIAGGLFVVPINAALQEIGHKTIGSGGAVAVQHFFENLVMLGTMAVYALAVKLGAVPVASMMVLGIIVMIATYLVSFHLPPDTAATDE